MMKAVSRGRLGRAALVAAAEGWPRCQTTAAPSLQSMGLERVRRGVRIIMGYLHSSVATISCLVEGLSGIKFKIFPSATLRPFVMARWLEGRNWLLSTSSAGGLASRRSDKMASALG